MTPIQALFAGQIRALYHARYSRELSLSDPDIVANARFFDVHSLREAEPVIVAFLEWLHADQGVREDIALHRHDDDE